MVEDVRNGEADGGAGDEDNFGEKRRGLSSGWLTRHAHSMPNAVTFVRHSTHTTAETHMCRQHKALSRLKQIPELWSEEKSGMGREQTSLCVHTVTSTWWGECECGNIQCKHRSSSGSKWSQGVVVPTAYSPDALSHTNIHTHFSNR